MSTSSSWSNSLTVVHPQNPNPIFSYSPHDHASTNLDTSEFELSDFWVLDNGAGTGEEDLWLQNMVCSDNVGAGGPPTGSSSSNSNMKCKGGVKKEKVNDGLTRVAFRTKSELEVMDDGFKWRKYGKKMVKNSPNPRNYYKCSSGGCNVKKKVERDREDPSYVITSYEGVHNHESPSVVYCTQMPLMPHGWTLQPAASSSSLSSSP